MIKDWNDYEYVKEQIDGVEHLPDHLRSIHNTELLLQTVNLSKISDNLRNKPDLVKDLINSFPVTFLLTDELRNDRNFVKSVGYRILEYASDELRNDKQFIIELVEDIKNSEDIDKEYCLEQIWNGMSDNLKYNKEFMNNIKDLDVVSSEKVDDLINEKGKLLEWHPWALDSGLSIMKYEMRNNPDILKNTSRIQGLSDELRDNKEFMMEVVKTHVDGYMFASDRLKKDPELLIAATESSTYNIMFANKELRNDKELIKEIIKRRGEAEYVFEVSGDKIKSDPEIAKIAIQDNPHSLEYANVKLQKDKDIVKLAINKLRNNDYRDAPRELDEKSVEELEERLSQIEREENESKSKEELIKELEETRARANKYRELFEKSQELLKEYDKLQKEEKGVGDIEPR